jgi:hypothetical protein
MNVSNAIYPLNVIADAFRRAGLSESVLIGTMAAAVHGASVLTEDFDYFVPPYRDLSQRIQRAADLLGAIVYKPKRHGGTTMLFVKATNLQVDLLVQASGIRSYRSIRTRAKLHPGLSDTLVASLTDVIRSKRAAGRPKDLAILPELEETLHEIERQKKRASTSSRSHRR